MKKCIVCKIDKEMTNFDWKNETLFIKERRCKECAIEERDLDKWRANTKQTCSLCGTEKTGLEFTVRHKDKRILRRDCKECRSKYHDQYYDKNIDKFLQDNKKRYANPETKRRMNSYEQSPEIVARKRIRRAQPHIRQLATEYQKQRYRNETNYKISAIVRSRLVDALNGMSKPGSAVRDLGCSIEEFKTYLQSKFYVNYKTGELMDWENQCHEGWHLDHIVPVSSFEDLSNRDQFLKAFNYTNYQPLWSKDNLEKSDRLDWEHPADKDPSLWQNKTKKASNE